ncbi:MAG TPA: hypothetical protein PK406_00820 [Verrucomicrobiota bacterium]|nr:hypothetical protein [Verrucomicrobiota bacterium]
MLRLEEEGRLLYARWPDGRFVICRAAADEWLYWMARECNACYLFAARAEVLALARAAGHEEGSDFYLRLVWA